MNGQPSQQGFTLIELLVSISIFTIITTVAVFNNSQFNGSVLLTNLAYEIGLSIREAQSYGISVRQDAASNFNAGYGVHFDLTTPTHYTLFEDDAADHVWSPADAQLQTFTISRGNKVSKICVDGSCSATVADISFIRPDPDAYITVGGIVGAYHGEADICIASPQGMKRLVTVASTGQISASLDSGGLCN
ncbi:MAG: type II secretion system protein [Patescibacteria group bacterium]|nr:type II secretion system protein [Patescibacteria group bacterium]MDE2116756.1 type II secretion system protein [Patescibacteria group bacterium]